MPPKSLLALLLCCALLASSVPSASVAHATVVTPTPLATASPWQVVQADAHQLVIEFTSPAYTLVTTANNAYQMLQMAGATYSDAPGQPQLPQFGQLVALPPTGTAQLKVLATTSSVILGQFSLAPAPSLLPRAAEDAPPTYTLAPDATTYAMNAYQPTTPAQLVDEAWWRDQRLARLQISPIQYNPSTGQLLWHQHLRLVITFPSVAAPLATPATTPSALRLPNLLNPEQAAKWRATTLPVQQAPLTPPVPGPWFKVVVDQDGIYRLTYAALQAAGMEVNSIDPRTFRLTNQGRIVAVEVSGEADGHFDPADSVTFYGQKFKGDYLAQRYQNENLQWLTYTGQRDDGSFATWQPGMNAEVFEEYTIENVYWLTAGSTPSPRITNLSAIPSGSAPIPSYYTTTVRAEEGVYWWNWHYTSQEVFFWGRAEFGNYTLTLPISLTAVANVPFTATLRAEMVAEGYNASAGPDHHTLLYMNFPTYTTAVDDDLWDGRALHAMQAPFAQSQLREGNNNLSFVMQTTPAVANDRIYFDWYSVQYARRFQAQNDQIIFPGLSAGRWQYRLTNFFSNTITLYDITDPLTPTRLTGATITPNGITYTVDFEVNRATNAQYIAASGAGLRSPKSLSRYDPPDLWAASNGADYLLITHADLLTATQTLANYHTSQGLRTKIVLIDDLYNQFNDGIFHPLAIKHFLAYVFANWQAPPPAYVVLIGDGHWNPLNFTARYGTPPPMYNPPNLSWADPYFGEVDSANLLATVVGDDPLADTYISRLPVNSDAELAAIVSKTIAYGQLGDLPWQRNLYFVADNIPDPAGDFVALSNYIINNEVPTNTYSTQRFYLNDYATPFSLTTALVGAINSSGALIVNYVGHGSNQRWAGEGILNTSHASLFTNTPQWPIVLSMTCLDGYWYYATPSLQGLMETLLRLDNKGILASFSPTGWGVATGHDYLHRGFYDAVFDNGVWQMGPATTLAKLTLYASGANYDLLDTYTVFGDPALQLHSPYRLAGSKNPAPQAGLPGQTLAYQVQVTNTGQLTDSVMFTASQLDWTTFTPTTIGPLAPGATTTATVTLTIVPNAPALVVDQVALQAHSVGDIAQTANFTLTASVNILRGVALGPTNSFRIGQPGQRITHTLTLTNTGNYTDTFSLSGSSSAWPTSYPLTVGPLGMGTSFTVTVPVTIPTNATLNQSTTFTLTATSQGNAGYNALVSLTTQAWWQARLYLPLVIR